jgi:imidazolonepropionase-like amidohydrolase
VAPRIFNRKILGLAESTRSAENSLSFQDVLAMLTTNPAAEFKVSSHAGSLKVGGDGDLTVLTADPAAGELQNVSRVLYTVRAGRLLF